MPLVGTPAARETDACAQRQSTPWTRARLGRRMTSRQAARRPLVARSGATRRWARARRQSSCPRRATRGRLRSQRSCAPPAPQAERRFAFHWRRGVPVQVTTSDLRGQVGRIQNQVKEIQEVVRMYSSTTGPRRVRRQKMDAMSSEVVDTNVRAAPRRTCTRRPCPPPLHRRAPLKRRAHAPSRLACMCSPTRG